MEHEHRYRPILTLPIEPDLALCLCCHWIASGPDAAVRAAGHRDATSHAVLAGRAERRLSTVEGHNAR
jgi:hypothetical protein